MPFFSAALFCGPFLVLLLLILEIKPHFVVKELEACCHHHIHLKCKDTEKIAIIQSRYVVASSTGPKTDSSSSGNIPVESRTLDVNATQNNTNKNSYLSLWDMDIQFTHDLRHPPIRYDYSSLNTPEWATAHKEIPRPHQYTPPDPLLNGLRFTSQRVLEMPPYEQKSQIDKDTVWTQPLFPLVQDETEGSQRRSVATGGGVSAISGRVGINLRRAGSNRIPGNRRDPRDPQPCYSYDSLVDTSSEEFFEFGSGSKRERKRKLPRPQWHYKDLRPVFNRRCSGKSECVVNLLRNKLRDQDLTSVCQKWPEGRILVKYLCFNSFSDEIKRMAFQCDDTDEKRYFDRIKAVALEEARQSHLDYFGDVHSKCNEDVGYSGEGFILNPGYPQIYAGDNPCQWRLHLPEPQKILLLFLDISLRGEEKSKCRDEIVVSDGSRKLLSTCGDHSSAIGLLSYTNRLNVTFTPESRLAFPKRGFLLYFRGLGCPLNPSLQPLHSYLVYQNGSHALFHCEPGYSFPGSMSQWFACNALLNKINNQSFAICSETALNLNMLDPENDLRWPSEPKIFSAEVFRETGLPILLLVVLFLLNLIVFFWIRRKRFMLQNTLESDMAAEFEEDSPTPQDSPTTLEESTFTLSSTGFEDGSSTLRLERPLRFRQGVMDTGQVASFQPARGGPQPADEGLGHDEAEEQPGHHESDEFVRPKCKALRGHPEPPMAQKGQPDIKGHVTGHTRLESQLTRDGYTLLGPSDSARSSSTLGSNLVPNESSPRPSPNSVPNTLSHFTRPRSQRRSTPV